MAHTSVWRARARLRAEEAVGLALQKPKEEPMQIAVIGGGNIGRTVGGAWARAGHSVIIGARDLSSPKAAAAAAVEGAQVMSIPEALAAAEVVLIAIPGAAVAAFAAEHGAALSAKLVIDSTNQFGQPVMSGIAALAAAAPQAMLARAFNSLGWENVAEPVISGIQADLLYVSHEGAARTLTEQLIADVGLRPIRVGDLGQVALVDIVGALWGALVFGQNMGRRLAFKVLT